MDYSSELLQEVSPYALEKFKTKLKAELPISVHALSFIIVLQNWKNKRPHLDVGFIAPHGNPNFGIVFYLVFDNVFNASIYAADKDAAEKLKGALKGIENIPILQKLTVQTGSFLFTCMTSLSFSAFENIIAKFDLREGDIVMWLPWDVARKMEIHVPEGVEVRELTKDHAKQINDDWPYKYPGSERLFSETIDVNFGFGVFRGESLISWGLYWFYGAIGAVATVPEERRKGYGSAVVQAITKKLGEMEIDVHLNIVEGNKSAVDFYRALGFQDAFTAYWAWL